jgi:anion-transporting  ArsA/GET3 family ATPase
MSMDTEAALREYLKLQMHLPVVGRLGPVARAFDFVASAAPGVREVLTIGKLCYEVRERNYDLVVADASSSGHIVGQLAAPEAINELVRGGRVLADTDWMMEILADASATGACITATPEEMPVSEALELAGRLRSETSVDLACVVANRVLPALFGRGEQGVFEGLAAPERVEALAATVHAAPETVREVLAAATLAAGMQRLGASHLRRLRAAIDPAVPVLYVPAFFGYGPGLEATSEVASALGEELGR